MYSVSQSEQKGIVRWDSESGNCDGMHKNEIKSENLYKHDYLMPNSTIITKWMNIFALVPYRIVHHYEPSRHGIIVNAYFVYILMTRNVLSFELKLARCHQYFFSLYLYLPSSLVYALFILWRAIDRSISSSTSSVFHFHFHFHLHSTPYIFNSTNMKRIFKC